SCQRWVGEFPSSVAWLAPVGSDLSTSELPACPYTPRFRLPQRQCKQQTVSFCSFRSFLLLRLELNEEAAALARRGLSKVGLRGLKDSSLYEIDRREATGKQPY